MVDRVDSWAVVMFIDFGQLATIPVQSLRSLDSDDFWAIPPLTQPFMLEEGKTPPGLALLTSGAGHCLPPGPSGAWRGQPGLGASSSVRWISPILGICLPLAKPPLHC